jgi:hypothetical protein
MPAMTQLGEAVGKNGIRDFYLAILDDSSTVNIGILDVGEHSFNENIAVIIYLRNTELPAEERILLFGAYDDGMSAQRLAQIAQHWESIVPAVEQTRLPSEAALTVFQRRCRRLRRALEIEKSRNGPGERGPEGSTD